MYRKGVLGIVINRNKEFLVLYRKLHWRGWEFPKGGIDNESEAEALNREIKEETGLDVTIICKLPFSIKYNYPQGFVKKTKTKYKGAKQNVYLVTGDGKVVLSREHSRYRWASYKEARKLLKHEDHKKALDIAYQYAL